MQKVESPYTGKATITPTLTGFQIRIPSKKIWIVLIFLGFWLFVWLAGGVMAVSSAFGDVAGQPSLMFAPFLIIWLLIWGTFGFFALKVFLWMAVGVEAIDIKNGQMTISKKMALFSKPKTYDLKEIKDMRIQEQGNSPFLMYVHVLNGLMSGQGTIKFDYGLKTIRMAEGVDEAEAKHIISLLKEKGYIN